MKKAQLTQMPLMGMNMTNSGIHVVADIYTLEQATKKNLIKFINQAIKVSNMSVVGFIDYNFNRDDAFSAVWLLEESHFTIHTYPELNYISVDCYTCGEKSRPISAIGFLMEKIHSVDSNLKVIRRGR